MKTRFLLAPLSADDDARAGFGASSIEPERSDPGRSRPSRAAVLEREEQLQEAEPGDHERFAHYVQKSKITESAVTGKPVIALCGKVWVPGRDPNKFPVCPTCKAIYEKMKPGPGKKDG